VHFEFQVALGATAFVAGGVASVAGFGIGSILTPLLALQVGTQLAVAAVSIPHFLGTALRFTLLRGKVDRYVLLQFGILSALGGLIGALLHSVAANPVLELLFGGLLVFAGLGALQGYTRRMRFGRGTAWVAGALSGLLGGLVGNQGGIRSAALVGFGLQRDAFVGTATAIGLIVDAARLPVYFVVAGAELRSLALTIGVASFGVLLGTLFGTRVLERIPPRVFQRMVGALILVLGIMMLVQALAEGN
jgi:uncharacterized membrane protein YfcA